MAFTYGGDPSASTTAAIRFAIGDTLSTDPLLTDAEIAYCYAQAGTVLGGALMAARRAAAMLAKEFDADLDGLSTKRSQRHKQLLDVIAQLEAESSQDNYTSTIPEIGAVEDEVAYPVRLEQSDEAGVEW